MKRNSFFLSFGISAIFLFLLLFVSFSQRNRSLWRSTRKLYIALMSSSFFVFHVTKTNSTFFSLSVLRMSRVCVLTWLWYESYDQIYANDSIIMYQVTLKFLFAIFAVLLRSLSRWLVWIKFQQTYRNIAFHRNCIPLSKHSRCALYRTAHIQSQHKIYHWHTHTQPPARTHSSIYFIHPSIHPVTDDECQVFYHFFLWTILSYTFKPFWHSFGEFSARRRFC